MWKTNCFLLTNIQLQTAVPFQTVIGEAEHTLWKRTLLLCSGDYGPWKHGYFTPDSDYTSLLPSTGDNGCTVCPWNLWWGQVMDCEHWDGVYSGLCSYVGVVCMCVCMCVCAGGGGARIVNIIILVDSLLMLPLFVFPLCACTGLVRDLFMLYHLSGTVSLSKIIKHTQIFQTISEISPLQAIPLTLCVCVCVCVCMRARARACMCERGHVRKSWFVLTVFWFFALQWAVLQFGEKAHKTEYTVIILWDYVSIQHSKLHKMES